MKASSSTSTATAVQNLSSLMTMLAQGRRVRSVMETDLARDMIADEHHLLRALKSWFISHDDDYFFCVSENSDLFCMSRDLATRLASAAVTSLGRVHRWPPKYSRKNHRDVWMVWIGICDLKFCSHNRKKARKKK